MKIGGIKNWRKVNEEIKTEGKFRKGKGGW